MAEEPTQVQDTAEVPANAEDRAQAGALSSLDTRGEDDASAKKEVDTEALGKAIKNLDVKDTPQQEKAKVVKVDAKDVALLVEQLELPKPKATDLLKQHYGDAVQAITAFITASG